MPRKVIITINPIQEDLQARSTANSPSTSGGGTSVTPPGAELLMYPEPFRSMAEGRVGSGARKKK